MSCQEPYWDQAGLSSLVNKQVAPGPATSCIELGPRELQLADLYVEWLDDIGSADCFTLSLKVSQCASLWKPGRLKHGSG